MASRTCSSSSKPVTTMLSARGLLCARRRMTWTPDPSGRPRSTSATSIGRLLSVAIASRTVPTVISGASGNTSPIRLSSQTRDTGSSSTIITVALVGTLSDILLLPCLETWGAPRCPRRHPTRLTELLPPRNSRGRGHLAPAARNCDACHDCPQVSVATSSLPDRRSTLRPTAPEYLYSVRSTELSPTDRFRRETRSTLGGNRG